MKIIIEIHEKNIDDILAVGADDLRKHFLPKAGINAKSVRIHHISAENLKLKMSGEQYGYIEEVSE